MSENNVKINNTSIAIYFFYSFILENTNIHTIKMYLNFTFKLFKGDRKRKLMKQKVIYPHKLFCVLKHIYKTLSGRDNKMQQITRFLSPLQS